MLELGLKLGAPLRVLLDVGAQILEMSNIQVADQWLKQSPPEEVAAAIFFDNDDQLHVLTRDGLTEPPQASRQLESMRNIGSKGVTKDRLVQ
ncbi:hypothetical protein MPER_00505, partial [Moniliophthora perniciosa FA553]